METPRRNFLKHIALGAAALPLIGTASANAAGTAEKSGESKRMGEAKFVDVDGIRTRYFDGGTGEPLVLIHGGQWPATASADGWSPIFDRLAEHFHVYAFDKLGMGFTDNPKTDADYSMDGIIRHAYGFIKAVGVQKCVLLGHSRGALPAARIAVDHPELVSHFICLDTNALAPDDPTAAERSDPPAERKVPTREDIRKAEMNSRMSYLKNFVTDAYVEGVYRIAQLPKIAEVDRKFREMRDKWVAEHPDEVKANPKLGHNTGASAWWLMKTKNETLDKIKAGGLKAPTVIIWGYNDVFAPFALGLNVMETVSKVVDRVELHAINHSGHFVASEHPEEVARLISGFVLG